MNDKDYWQNLEEQEESFNNKKIENRLWKKAESSVAKRTGARKTHASGSKGEKGDCVNSKYCFEVKSTIRRYYTLSIESLYKIKRQAGTRIPVLVIEFGDGLQRYLVMSDEDMVPTSEEVKFDWSTSVTVTLYSSSLEEGDHILVNKDVWIVKNPKDLRD